MKKILSVFFSFLFLFGIFASPSFASLDDKQYFGITGTEASDAVLSDLGINMFYTWSSIGYTPATSFGPYTKFLTLRLGKFWWADASQGFSATVSPDPNGCNQAISFMYGGTNYYYPYNKCAIQNKITAFYNNANGNSGTSTAQSIKYYVIGNEPNLLRAEQPGDTAANNDSDGTLPADISPSNTGLAAKYHAEQYRAIYTELNAFKATHSDVRIVGPSVIGYSSGLNNGKAWFDAFISGYGSLPPMDYLNYHSYDTGLLNTDGTPYTGGTYKRRLDASVMATDLSNFRTDMNNNGYTGKEIFITEFGTPNCGSGCQNRTFSEVQSYLDQVINNFRANRTNYLLKGWMLFSLTEGSGNPVSLRTTGGAATAMSNWYKDKIAQEFSDVPPTINPHDKFDKIQKFYLTKEVTDGTKISGCKTVEQDTTGLKKFCIDEIINRQDFSKFLITAMQQSKSTAANQFTDVSPLLAPYVMRMKELNITNGYNAITFGAGDPLTRGTTVIFIGRAQRTNETAFQLPQQASFSDVTDRTLEIFRAVEYGKANSIVFGCGNGQFCPNDNVRRDDMAVFLMRAFPNDVQYTP